MAANTKETSAAATMTSTRLAPAERALIDVVLQSITRDKS